MSKRLPSRAKSLEAQLGGILDRVSKEKVPQPVGKICAVVCVQGRKLKLVAGWQAAKKMANDKRYARGFCVQNVAQPCRKS